MPSFNALTGTGSWLESLFGRKPDVPPLARLNLPEEQLAAIDANIAAEPKARELARLSQEQLLAMANFGIKGFSSLSDLAVGNIGGALRGIIPSDVSQAVQRNAAARSLTGGFGGTGMSRALEARDLGLTSLAQQRWGQSALQSWLGAIEQLYAPSQAIYSSSFITPQQQYAVERNEENLQFARNWQQEQINAMPDPVARGIFDTVMELVNSYLGGTHQSVPSQAYSNPGGGGMGGGGTPGVGSGWGGWGGGNTFSGPGGADVGAGPGAAGLGGAASIPAF
jgi:hypothetical protein